MIVEPRPRVGADELEGRSPTGGGQDRHPRAAAEAEIAFAS
jgi:hypothetical protein